MGRVLERAYAAFGEEARRRGIDYRQHANGGAVLYTDGDRVLQIISNLLANAFRWTPDGGRIDLELDAANGDVSVAVADSGPGISPEEAERIFRPFWSRDGGGTGLGLAIAHELAQRARRPDRARQRGRPRQPLPARPAGRPRAALASRPHVVAPAARGAARARAGRPAARPPGPRPRGSRRAAPAPVVEEPAPVRRDPLRGRARRPRPLGRGGDGRSSPTAPPRARLTSPTTFAMSASDRLHPLKRERPIARGELSERAALVLAGGLAAFALGLGAGARPGDGAPAGGLPRPSGGVHALAAQRRAARRDGHRRPVRRARGRGRRGRRRAHLALAAALHGAARALPRAGEAAG